MKTNDSQRKKTRLFRPVILLCLASLCVSCKRTVEIRMPEDSSAPEEVLSANADTGPGAPQTDGTSPAPKENLFSFSLTLDGETFSFPAGYEEFTAAGYRMDAAGEKVFAEKILAPSESCGDIVLFGGALSFQAFFYNDGESSAPLSECRIFGVAVGEAMSQGYASETVVGSRADDISETGAQTDEREAAGTDAGPRAEISGAVTLPGGIRLGGATLTDIEEAYGPADNVYYPDGLIQLSYEYDSGQNVLLDINSSSDLLTGIDLHNFPGDHARHPSFEGTNAPAPYRAPEALGDSLLSGRLELDGVVMGLPAPVCVLLNDGWLPDSSVSHIAKDNRLDSLTTEVLTLKKDGGKIHISASNPSGQAEDLKDCLVTRITFPAEDLGGHTLTLPGGIGFGTDKKTLNAALKGIDFSLSRGLSSTCYIVSDTDHGISLELIADKDSQKIEWIELNVTLTQSQ